MKKLIMLMLMLSAMFSAGFRGNSWGTSLEMIKESSKLHEKDENTLMYSGVLGNENIYVLYSFRNNKLWKGIIHAEVSETFYQYLKELVTKKYGDGTENIYDTEYNEYTTLQKNYEYGWLMKSTKWQVGDTVIELLAGTSMLLSFHHKQTYELIEEQKKAQDLQSI